jgi:DNA-binding response OmpR family regulator
MAQNMQGKQHILIVDDDALMRRSLAYNLEQAGYTTNTAGTAEDALARIEFAPPDLVILDIGLPGMDGLDALRQIQRTQPVPVIFLTARRRELDEVLGLELGADDYVTKPFDIDVLLARIKAVLRRSPTAPALQSRNAEPIVVGDLRVDPAAHTVMLGDKPVDLAPREFDLLTALARQAGQVISIDDLLAQVWGAEFAGEPQVVYVHIRWLREKLEDDPQNPERIITVRGVGYKLLRPESP